METIRVGDVWRAPRHVPTENHQLTLELLRGFRRVSCIVHVHLTQS